MRNLISTRVAIIVFAVVIGFFGANHFLHAKDMAENVPAFLPLPKVLVYISGAGFLLAAVSFIIDHYVKIAGYLLALLLLLIVFLVDIPGIFSAENVHVKMIFVTSMFKDVALAMAAVVIADISRIRRF
jgi:uncharacterized membrane protein